MAQQIIEVSKTGSSRTVSEGNRWRLDMEEATETTDKERRKNSRMFGEMFVRFSAVVEEVDDGCVTLSVLTSNTHRSAPDMGASVVKHEDQMINNPEWTRMGGK